MRQFIAPMLLVLAAQATALGQPTAKPSSTFKAVLHPTNVGLPQGAYYGDFTLKGPVEKTLVRLPDGIGEVVSDGTGEWLFGMGGHQLYQLDLANRTATAIVAKDVPEVSWTMGLSYDTKRNRVLLATLGGEGYIYAYDHENETWSVVGSFDNVDVTAIAYLESSDRIYAIASAPFQDGRRQAALYEYSAASGRRLRHRTIDLPLVGSFIDRGLQLIPVDDSLVFVQMPASAKDGESPLIHLIDPESGKVRPAEK